MPRRPTLESGLGRCRGATDVPSTGRATFGFGATGFVTAGCCLFSSDSISGRESFETSGTGDF